MKHQDYTVAWLSALPHEQAAAFLDETHEKLPASKHDTTYILGRVDVHNVIIACLPTMGMTATTRCVGRLEHSFPSLRFILLVGIGRGVPTIEDVRLGDVVVSMPTKTSSGIVQYDFGTKFQDDKLEIRDAALGPPADLLMTAVSALDAKGAQRQAGPSLCQRLELFARQATDTHSNMDSVSPAYQDMLFAADYRHLDDRLNCVECRCSPAQCIKRPPRPTNCLTRVHQGLIASGSEVMRDAKERDRLAKERGVLCFEMEAAGLKTDLGWLVIRGICNYCDSHKDKRWQDYAAVVAAAYARELLQVVPGLKEEQATAGAKEEGPTKTRFDQSSMSGGQLNNFQGNMHTSGGHAFFGSNIRSDGPINFSA